LTRRAEAIIGRRNSVLWHARNVEQANGLQVAEESPDTDDEMRNKAAQAYRAESYKSK